MFQSASMSLCLAVNKATCAGAMGSLFFIHLMEHSRKNLCISICKKEKCKESPKRKRILLRLRELVFIRFVNMIIYRSTSTKQMKINMLRSLGENAIKKE